MNDDLYTYTKEQREHLEQKPQFHAVSFLDDGDLVICEDVGPISSQDPGLGLSLWATWALTRDGKVHELTHHYHTYHDWEAQAPGRQAAETLTPPAIHPPRIIDVHQAVQHLLLKYHVDVSPRTVRNWLADGKLAGSQLGTSERAPWYTTHDAIGQAATRGWFPAPLPELSPQQADGEVAGDAPG